MSRMINSRKRFVIALALTLMALFLTVAGLAKTYSDFRKENFAEAYSLIPPVLSSRSSIAFPSRNLGADSNYLTLQEGPTISTDKTGYLGGETVAITGSGFISGTLVMLRATHADGTAESAMGHEPFTVAADDAGNFAATWTINRNDVAGEEFVLTAERAGSATPLTTAFRRIATVGTDKFDYQPGETAHITGAGFRPGEAVTIQVEHSNGLEDGLGHAP